MAQYYEVKNLLETKSRHQFNFEEKVLILSFLKECSHFKDIISQESESQISQVYRYSLLRKFDKYDFIYHQTAPLNHLYIVLQGKVSCFIPHEDKYVNNQLAFQNELSSGEGNNFGQGGTSKMKIKESAEKVLQEYRNIEDELLLRNDPKKIDLYFDGDTCLFKSIKQFQPTEAFGGFTPFHIASFIATEETFLLMIPSNKYAKLFKPEVQRFKFVTKALAELFCKSEEKISSHFAEEQEEQLKKNKGLLIHDKLSLRSGIIVRNHLLDQFCIQSDTKRDGKEMNQISEEQQAEEEEEEGQQNYQKQQDTELAKLNHNQSFKSLLKYQKSRSKLFEQENVSFNCRNNTSVDQKNKDSKKNTFKINGVIGFRYEEKLKGVQNALECSEISFAFSKLVCDKEKETLLYEENEEVVYYYLVAKGNVRLNKLGAKEAIKQYGRKDLFGFEDDGNKRLFSCIAEKGAIVFYIPKQKFEIHLRTALFSLFKLLQRAAKKQLLIQVATSGIQVIAMNQQDSTQMIKEVKWDDKLSSCCQDNYSQNMCKSNNNSLKDLVDSMKVNRRSYSERDRQQSKTNHVLSKSNQDSSRSISSEFKSSVDVSFKKVIQLPTNRKLFLIPQNFKSKLTNSSFIKNQESQLFSSNPLITQGSNNSFLCSQQQSQSKQEIFFSPYKKEQDSAHKNYQINTGSPNIFTRSNNTSFNRSQKVINLINNKEKIIDKDFIQIQSDELSTSNLLRHPFSTYEKLPTFSQLYHKRKNIIAVSIQKYPPTNSSQSNHLSLISHQESKQDNENNYFGMGSISKKHDMKLIEQEVTRSLHHIPKTFQDKLWGKRGFEALSQLFGRKYESKI